MSLSIYPKGRKIVCEFTQYSPNSAAHYHFYGDGKTEKEAMVALIYELAKRIENIRALNWAITLKTNWGFSKKHTPTGMPYKSLFTKKQLMAGGKRAAKKLEKRLSRRV